MLSICIPTYNYDIEELAKDIRQQCEAAGIEYELLIYADASKAEFHPLYHSLQQLEHVAVHIAEKNAGRSRARNWLASEAKHPRLLFLDDDSGLPDQNFITRYIETDIAKYPVVCGGTIYEKVFPGKSKSLRWKYGIAREERSASVRSKFPNRSFTTNNFMISKELAQSVRFDTTLVGYGHEDTLFGNELKKRNIRMQHIDNPVIHKGLESNEVFLKKTINALQNLKFLSVTHQNKPEMLQGITLLQMVEQLNKYRLAGLPAFLYRRFHKPMFKYLMRSKKPFLPLFDLYKLGYFLNIKQTKRDETI